MVPCPLVLVCPFLPVFGFLIFPFHFLGTFLKEFPFFPKQKKREKNSLLDYGVVLYWLHHTLWVMLLYKSLTCSNHNHHHYYLKSFSLLN